MSCSFGEYPATRGRGLIFPTDTFVCWGDVTNRVRVLHSYGDLYNKPQSVMGLMAAPRHR